MDTELNGLPQRSLMMNRYWVLQACIVLAVGVGLVSCTKEQKTQGMGQPAEAIQPVSPCHSTGVSSTGTPEFCVHVTEIQLFNHETQADVHLSLMNRTGHRLYIALIGLTSLTDSGGRKWNTRESTGLGGLNTPVSVEPNGETQATVSFSRTGQAPADPVFSLRGEIGIMAMDSRGYAVPGQIATKRGIFLSGIHIQQQPFQATGATELQKDTKTANVSPRRANHTASKPSTSSKSSGPGAVVDAAGSGKPQSQKLASANVSHSSNQRSVTIDSPAASTAASKSGSRSVGSGGSGPDVIGLRIGMTPDQARQKFKMHGFGSSTKSPNRPFDSYTESSNTLTFSLPGQAPQPVPHTKYVAQISGAISDVKIPATENSGDVLTIFFGPNPGQGGIVLLNRTEYIPASKRPTVAAFAKTLVEKYGAPTELQPGSLGIFRWRYDSSGTLYSPTSGASFSGCPRLKPGIVEFQSLRSPVMIQEYKQSVPKCGAIFLEVDMGFAEFKYAGPETLIKSYTTHMTGLDATIRALDGAKEIVDKAQAEASGTVAKKAQQQKPGI